MGLSGNSAAPAGVLASRATIKRITGTNPAAATEVSETVPAGAAWELKAVTVILDTDDTDPVWPSLVIDDGATVVFRSLSGTAAQAVSISSRHTWAPGLPQSGGASDLARTGVLPSGLVLLAGWRVRTLTETLGGTDNYGSPTMYVVEYSS